MRTLLRFGTIALGLLIVAALLLPSGALATQEVKIGVIYPLTGGAAAAGRELRAGAELAAEIANGSMPGLTMTMAKNKGVPTFLVGHVTKDGAIAGPKLLHAPRHSKHTESQFHASVFLCD